jgi:DNA-binding transcriptional MerR regulator
MKDYLTIGDLAKMMNVSTHQIRYYEEQGVLLPDEIGNNGYRKYGTRAIYTLSHILYLREFDISVAEIQNCIKEYTKSDYHELLVIKIKDMEAEIKRLIELKDYTINVVQHLEKADNEAEQFIIKFIPKRNFRKLCRVYDSKDFTVKDMYKYFEGIPDLYKIDIITYLDEKKAYVGYETNEYDKKDCLDLPEGDYLTYMLTVRDEKEIDIAVKKIWKYANEKGMKLEEKILIRENSMLSITEKDTLYYDIEVPILKL